MFMSCDGEDCTEPVLRSNRGVSLSMLGLTCLCGIPGKSRQLVV